MTKKILIWALAIILLAMPVLGAVNDSIRYYSLDIADSTGNVIHDLAGNDNMTNYSMTPTSFILNEGMEGTTSSYLYGGARIGASNTGAMSIWFNADDENDMLFYQSYTEGASGTFVQASSNGDPNEIRIALGGSAVYFSNCHWTVGNTHHLVITWDGATYFCYMNGTLLDTISSATDFWGGGGSSFLVIAGAYYSGSPSSQFDGTIDEVAIYDHNLSVSDVAELWNGGLGYDPYHPPVPGSTTDVDFTITDQWNSSSILSFNINVSWSNGTQETYLTTNGTVSLINITAGAINVTYWNMTDYFDASTTDTLIVNVSNTVTTTTYQAYLCLNATSKVNEAWVTADNFTIGSTTHASCFNITAGSHNVMAQKAGWFSQNQTLTVTALSNATQTVYNMSYANLTIYAIDGTTNESLSGYNILIGSIANPFFSETATGATNHSFYLINDTYNTTITMPGYATTTGQANISVSGHTNYTFTLYRANSVTITIRDEITNAIITDNVTVRWTNNASTWENVTNTGGMFVSNLTVGNYTLLFYSTNYSTRTYTITVGNLSTQFLTAYMISSAYSTIFTVKDKDTGDILPDVSFTMQKLVNTTWTTVESKYSDITGKVKVYYDPIGNYRFYLTLTNYEDLVFYLNPILFSTYDVFMEKASLLNYTVDYDDISIIYAPHSFNNNDNTTFNFLIASPDGLLTNYGLTLTYPGGSQSASGVNAIGEQLSVWANITNATRWDRVRLDFNYTTSLAGTRTFTQYLDIITNSTASENTWMANKDRTFGMGLFERFLIVTIIIIFTVGIASLVGQAVPGMAIGLFLFGFMVYIGFIPIWGVIPSMIIGVIFLVWKSGGY